MPRRSRSRTSRPVPKNIRLAGMPFVRRPLSRHNVDNFLDARSIKISQETIRFWWNRFSPMFATEIRRKRVDRMRSLPPWRWHLNEVLVSAKSVAPNLWRAVNHEGDVLQGLGPKRRTQKAALKLPSSPMKRHGRPHGVVPDMLRSYGAALKHLGLPDDRKTGR